MNFSVIVSVRNEAPHIDECLRAIFEQDYDRPYEVIVVDGMSTDGTYEILEQYRGRDRFVLLQNEKHNAAAGRNLGIENAQAEFLAFVDADAVPAPDWLRRIEAAFEKHKEVAGVGGPDLLPEDSRANAQIFAQVMTSPLARGGRFNPSTQHTLWEQAQFVHHIPTCNLCLRKTAVDAVGRFDEDFVKGQDLELNYRITKAGFKLLYAPDVQVLHYRKERLADFVKQIYKWAKAKVALTRKHGFNGLTSHIYFWPVYCLGFLTAAFVLAAILDAWPWLAALLIVGAGAYGLIILVEALRLSVRFSKVSVLPRAALLLVVVHVSYACGVFAALLKRKIW